MGRHHHDFTKEDDELLIKGKNEGMSFTKIAAKYFPALSGNSLIGRWHRLGMSKPRSGVSINLGSIQEKKQSRSKKTRFYPTALNPKNDGVYVTQRLEPTSRRPVRLTKLKLKQCKWPVNDPAPKEYFLFCGLVRKGSGPYCAAHTKIAFK
jgi:GcrA cell cycle regulator